MNPMVKKELRQRMRERRAWSLPTLYLLILGGAVALAYFFATESFMGFEPFLQPQGAEIGLKVFGTVAFTQMAVLLLMVPVFSAGSLTIEKEQRTLGALITSLLTPGQIWWGKFLSSILFLVLLLVTSLPVLSLTFALGGIGPWAVLQVTGMTLLVLASMCAVGLYCSSYFRRSVHATAVTYGVVIALTVLTFVVFLILESRWQAVPAHHDQPMPDYIAWPLYLNPFFALASVSLDGSWQGYPAWLVPVLLFIAIGCLSAALALRNLQHGGEQL